MNVKLSRAQELHLIAIGLNTLLNDTGVSKIISKPKRTAWNKGLKGKKKSAWTAERRKKFSETMRKKWANK
jgi:hypothetical protein